MTWLLSCLMVVGAVAALVYRRDMAAAAVRVGAVLLVIAVMFFTAAWFALDRDPVDPAVNLPFAIVIIASVILAAVAGCVLLGAAIGYVIRETEDVEDDDVDIDELWRAHQ